MHIEEKNNIKNIIFDIIGTIIGAFIMAIGVSYYQINYLQEELQELQQLRITYLIYQWEQ